MKLIDKDKVVKEIERRIANHNKELERASDEDFVSSWASDEENQKLALTALIPFLNTLEVIDPYEQCIQYASVESGIKTHAEVYSFNIESELFNQLTKEQQALWRKEIEQAVISGGEMGVGLAKDTRYKENLEVKEVDLEKLGEIARHLIAVGYHQAEKDNELTWEDMRELYIIFAEVDTEIELRKTDITAETLGYYQEVLKRFKDFRERKEK